MSLLTVSVDAAVCKTCRECFLLVALTTICLLWLFTLLFSVLREELGNETMFKNCWRFWLSPGWLCAKQVWTTGRFTSSCKQLYCWFQDLQVWLYSPASKLMCPAGPGIPQRELVQAGWVPSFLPSHSPAIASEVIRTWMKKG